MKNDKQKEPCAKGSETSKERDDSVPFWNVFGWTTISSNSKPKHNENKCPFSQDITYSIIDDSIADFSGSGVLQGKKNFEPDEPDSLDGISYYNNCFGENIASFVDWGSEFYTVRGDIYNPNKWCVEVVIGDEITVIGQYAFYGLDSMRRVTIKGKNTLIVDGEIPNNVIICAQSDSVAKRYAQKNGNPFEKLKNPFLKNLPDCSIFKYKYLAEKLGVFKTKSEEPTVYRAIPTADYGYSISAETNGSVEITGYDRDGVPITKTYGKVPKRQFKRFKIQICPIKEIYLIAKHINLDNAAVIMCSSYHIDDEKVCGIKNKLCLEFDDTTIIRSPRAFNIDIAKRIRTFIDSLGKEITVLYICCNSGESRSTALSAAIMRYVKMSDKDIWENPYYHPNPLVYKLQCKAFGIFVSKLGTQKRVRMNEKALRRKMNSSNKRK